MKELNIEPHLAINTAKGVDLMNEKIKIDFSQVDLEFSKLWTSWHSQAKNRAQESFNYLKDTYIEPRYNLVKVECTLLEKLVGEGYQTIESVNKEFGSMMRQM